jgi:serine protease Do
MRRSASGVPAALPGTGRSAHATFVHLSGSQRGRRETFGPAPTRIGTAPDCTLRFSAVADPAVSHHHAQVRFEDCAFLLTDLGSAAGTFVNGVQVTEVILQDGDLIELGQGGPRVRFRVYAQEVNRCTPFRVILADSQAVARAESTGHLGGATRFVTTLARGVLREASWSVKGAGLVLALLLASLLVGAPVALYRAQRATEQAVTQLAIRFQGERVRREDLERRVSEGRQLVQGARGALADLVATLRIERQQQAARLAGIDGQLRALEAERGSGERIIRTYAGGVALLHGAVIFEDASGRPLRYLGTDAHGGPLRDPLGRAPVSVDGTGAVVTTMFMGTAFLVSGNGALLTSRHVVEPWTEDEEMRAVLGLGVRPRVALRAFFPEVPDPVPVAVVRASAEADVALLKGEIQGRSLPVLALDRTGREAVPGRAMLLLGYPGGVDLLLARVEPSVLQPLMAEDAVDLAALLDRLGRQGAIRPYATWGHLAGVRPHEIDYDAATTLGGSGGPILSLGGRVVGVNYAVARNFGGASFGVPIRFGLALLSGGQGGDGRRPPQVGAVLTPP